MFSVNSALPVMLASLICTTTEISLPAYLFSAVSTRREAEDSSKVTTELSSSSDIYLDCTEADLILKLVKSLPQSGL